MQAKRLADLQWWCKQLAGAPLEPLLKTDYPRGPRVNMGQNQGDIVEVHTDSHVSWLLSFSSCLLFFKTCAPTQGLKYGDTDTECLMR